METNNQNNDFLRKVAEQCADKMARAIVERIENGAKIKKSHAGVNVDGVFIVEGDKKNGVKPALVLRLDAPEIENLFEPDKTDLEKRAQELREELQQIENQLNTPEQ